MGLDAHSRAIVEEAVALSLARESLRHPKHATVLVPLRARLQRLLIKRWNRQQREFLKEARHWLERFAAGHHASEAADPDLKAKLQRLVTARIEAGTAMSQAPSRNDTAAYEAAVEAAASGAIDNLSVDLDIEVAADAGKTFAREYLEKRGFHQLAADIDATSRDRIANAVADTFASNGTFDDAVKAIRGAFDAMKESRAQTIAETELADAYNQAMLSSAKESGDLLKTWNLDGEGCPEICEPNAADGAIELDEDFSSGDDAPPAHPNCVLAGTLITAGRVTGGTRRWYEGEILVLKIPGMPDCSITPNHPIFGPEGWKPARELQRGDYVFQCLAPSAMASLLYPDDHHIEARIEQIVEALFKAGGMASFRMPIPAEAFHGDIGPDCEVDIIRTASSFVHDIPEALQDREHLDFGAAQGPRMALEMECPLLHRLLGVDHAAHGFVGSRRLSFPHSFRHRSGPDQPRRTSIALLEPERFPAAQNRGSRNADSERNRQEAFASQMRLVQLDGIEWRRFAGHVYNLQTTDGFYFANSIVTHNCDCSIGFVRTGEE